MPQLSVITINYNDANGLEKTIVSLVNQSYQDFELIVIDGGSYDGSVDVIKKYIPAISYWVSEKDKGIYNAQNKGINKAHGNYCLFLNSGDYLADNKVLETVFAENRKEDIVYGDMLTIDESGEMKRLNMPDFVGVKRMLADTIWHPVTFIKKELFNKFGCYNEDYRIAADYDFFVHVLISEKVSQKHLPIVICVFDRTGISSDPSNMKSLIEERNKIQNTYFNYFVLILFRLYSKLRN